MSNKIKRGGNGMFGRTKNNIWVKIVIWVVALGILFYGGYYLGSAILKKSSGKPAEQSSSETGSSSRPSEQPSEKPAVSSPESTADGPILFCPSDILTDAGKRADFIRDAAEQKASGIAFFAKDENGRVWFAAENEIARRSKALSDRAADAKTLSEEFRKAGLKGIPVLYTFRDPLTPSKNPAMGIWYNNGIDNYLWLDNFADKGGKAWLNPYHKDARGYILSLSDELYQAGFQTVIFAGNEFGASAKNNSATYGDVKGTHLEAMTAFVNECEQQAGRHKAVCYFAEDAEALLRGGRNLGASFMETGASHIAPAFSLSRLSHNLKAGDRTFKVPSDDPAGVTEALMAAYAKKNSRASFLPVFFDYKSVASLQAGALKEGTPYLIVQSK